MEVKQVGNMAQAAARSAQPYRRHIVGLPLQRSLFGQAARAATTNRFARSNVRAGFSSAAG